MLHVKPMIYFENAQEIIPVTYKLKRLTRAAVVATLEHEQYHNPCEVSITYTDNASIHNLNLQDREVDAPTDVLSFPLMDFSGESDEPVADEPVVSLGDIVISLERAAAQALEYGHSFEREVAFLTAHSMLHLLGYDHEESEAADLDMRARQSRVMDTLGLSLASACEAD